MNLIFELILEKYVANNFLTFRHYEFLWSHGISLQKLPNGRSYKFNLIGEVYQPRTDATQYFECFSARSYEYESEKLQRNCKYLMQEGMCRLPLRALRALRGQ